VDGEGIDPDNCCYYQHCRDQTVGDFSVSHRRHA
jgi:hypothetical protein